MIYTAFRKSFCRGVFHCSPENCTLPEKVKKTFQLSSGIFNNFLAEKCAPYCALHTLVINHHNKFNLNLIYNQSKRPWEFTCIRCQGISRTICSIIDKSSFFQRFHNLIMHSTHKNLRVLIKWMIICGVACLHVSSTCRHWPAGWCHSSLFAVVWLSSLQMED